MKEDIRISKITTWHERHFNDGTKDVKNKFLSRICAVIEEEKRKILMHVKQEKKTY